MRGDTAIAKVLRIQGIEQVFCFPLTPILEALVKEGIRPIVSRQERVAENMADGFSRICNGEWVGANELIYLTRKMSPPGAGFLPS